MPLTLVTGPANAEKARVVLDAYRAHVARGDDPILVVPTFADVEHYRRELAAGGAVFGVQVLAPRAFERELARRAGVAGGPVDALARERIAAAAVAGTRLEAMAAAAATPGFPRALVRFVSELQGLRIQPPRLARALSDWAGDDPARTAYGRELAGLYRSYRERLEALGRRDADLQLALALDEIRLKPSRWGGTPVLFYGFDDLRPLQVDAVETLARHAEAEVTLSLTFEPGRAAFASRARMHADLQAVADRPPIVLGARPDHYVHPALHHIERGLFEAGDSALAAAPAEQLALDGLGVGASPAVDSERVDPGDAVRFLEAGGDRAEVELVAAQVAQLIREHGYAAEDIAVVWRDTRPTAALAEQVFQAYGIPYALTRRIALGHTALGRGLIALGRCALLEGSADDLLTWLRTPGFLRRPALADRLEATARQEGAVTAAAARELWERSHPDFLLGEIDEVAEAGRRGPAALCRRLAATAGRLLATPLERTAPIFTGGEALDANVAGRARGALEGLGRLAQADRALGGEPAELLRTIGELELTIGAFPGPGRVSITTPGFLRARRVRALFLCGLQEGAFPRPAHPDPFLGDEDRMALNVASGLGLRHHEDTVAMERFLFYTAASRPTDLLALSWHTADDDGKPTVRSFFVDDVADLLAPEAMERRSRRPLGAAGWDAAIAPTAREARLAAAAREGELAGSSEPIAELRDEEVLRSLRERPTWSASALEAWTACPVRWFVEQLLRPEGLEPDPEPLVRGTFAHEALEAVYRELPDGRLEPAGLPAARGVLHRVLGELEGRHRISVNPDRLRAEVRRLESDLVRFLEHAAHDGSTFGATDLEVRFGGAKDPLPAAALAGGELQLAGRIDRVDRNAAGEAIIRDYKGRSAVAGAAKWLEKGKLQMGLYMLAAADVLGVEPVGGLYQQLGPEQLKPRGLLHEDADPDLKVGRDDRVSPEEARAILDEIERAALDAVNEIRQGRLKPRPDTCGWAGGGCSYPSICRCARS